MRKLEKLIKTLQIKKLKIATVESATAGYASYLLTKVPGASKVFMGGFVVYSLESKAHFFNLPLPILRKTQGVSAEIALALARGVRKLLKTDLGASIVGFAGPFGTNKVPAGTIFIAVSDKNGAFAKKLSIKGSRDTVRKKASYRLIELIYSRVTG
ncbi:MAG: CinA family protein [Candidatus Omnitrophica bacterium]|nr:CinA family protein [Candidatus Omnitrophota bacterium]